MFMFLIPALAGVAAFLLGSSGYAFLQRMRLRRQALSLVGKTATRTPKGRSDRMREKFFRLVAWLGNAQERHIPTAWKIQVEKQLAQVPVWAGKNAAEWLAAKELSALAGLLFGWLLDAGVLMTLALAAAAFLLPDLWLREQGAARKKTILKELPDTLDLLASCMEAGLGFEQAAAIILERSRKGPLHWELTEMMRSVRMGLSRRDALKNMSGRVDHPDFSTFISALIQAERLGVSVALALKQQAVQLRTKRSQLVEKQALEAPIKLLFPLVIFIFPVVFLVLFGPIIIRFLQGF